MEAIITIVSLLTLLFGGIGFVVVCCAKLLETCNPHIKDETSSEVEEQKDTPSLVPSIYGKMDMLKNISNMFDESRTCPVRNWEIWELNNDLDGFNKQHHFWEGNLVSYCKTRDSICSALMDFSLTHDIYLVKMNKSIGETWSSIKIAVVKSHNVESNIDADIIEAISNMTTEKFDENDIIDDAVACLWARM